MKNIAIVDAGPLIALFDSSDQYHPKAKERLAAYRKEGGSLISTWPVVTEVAHLLKKKVHFEAEMDFLKWISMGGAELFELERNDLHHIVELQSKYSDLSMDFADATLVLVAERLAIDKIFSFDKDFSIYRIPIKKHFHNLMK